MLLLSGEQCKYFRADLFHYLLSSVQSQRGMPAMPKIRISDLFVDGKVLMIAYHVLLLQCHICHNYYAGMIFLKQIILMLMIIIKFINALQLHYVR
jgi:hypothetical protein